MSTKAGYVQTVVQQDKRPRLEKRYQSIKDDYDELFPTRTMINKLKGTSKEEKAKMRSYTDSERRALFAYLLYTQLLAMNDAEQSGMGVNKGALDRAYDNMFKMEQDAQKKSRGKALQSVLDGKAIDIRTADNKKATEGVIIRYARQISRIKQKMLAAESGTEGGRASALDTDSDALGGKTDTDALKDKLRELKKQIDDIKTKHFDGKNPTKQQMAETDEGERFKELVAEYRKVAARRKKALDVTSPTPTTPSTPVSAGDEEIDTETPTISMTVKKKKRDDGAGAGAVTEQPSPVTPKIVPYGETPPKADAVERVYDEEEDVPVVTGTSVMPTEPIPELRGKLTGEKEETLEFGDTVPDSTDAENIEDAMLAGEVEPNEPTMDVEMLPNPNVNTIAEAKAANIDREDEKRTEKEITDTIRRDATRQTDTVLTRDHQEADGSVPDPNLPRVSAGSARAAERGLELGVAERERVEQMYRNFAANPMNAGVRNPYEAMLQALNVAQVGEDAANAADYEGGADNYENIVNEGNVGAQSEGDPTLGGGANTDYYYDFSAFEGGAQGAGGAGAAPQVGQAVMSKLQSAQSAAADVSTGAMERAMQGKSVEQIKQDIKALCMLFASVIPALNSPEIQTEKRRVMATSARVPVANFYRKLMQMVKQFYSSDDLKVGVIVSPQSMGAQGGGGMGGMGGLPGMGSAGYKMNAHGQIEPFSGVQRGDQYVNRGGRHYRDPIRSRVPLNLPELRPKPVQLQRCMGYANVPFPNIKRAFTTGETFTLKGASQRQAQMVDD